MQRNRLIIRVQRNQTLLAELFDIRVTVDYENTDFAFLDCILLLNKDFVAIMKFRLHTVTGNRQSKVCTLCFARFINKDWFGGFIIKEGTGTGGCWNVGLFTKEYKGLYSWF